MRRRVKLRPVAAADHATLAALRADVELQHLLLANPPPGGDHDVAAWIARRQAEGAIWTVADRADDVCLGYVQIAAIHRRNRHAHFGIALAPGWRGLGVGEAATIALLSEARALGLFKLLLEARVDNHGAIALYEKLGFRRVGTLQHHYDDGGRRHDVLVMEREIPEEPAA